METGQPARDVRLPNDQVASEPAAAGGRLLLVPLRTGEVAVWDYRAGKENVFGFLTGQVMKASRGKANPVVAQRLLRERLRP